MADNSLAMDAAAKSSLMSYVWHDKRGRAPAGYTKGMAAAFAEAYRMLKAGDPILTALTRARSVTPVPEHDVLDWYSGELNDVGAKDADAADRLIALFAVLMGLGMQESSGRHCDGPDTPTDRGPKGQPVPTTAQNAEAGLFQVSWDSIAQHAHRQAIVNAYAGRTDLLADFAEGSGCKKPRDWPADNPHWPSDFGTGKPADFQTQMKNCPLFAVIYSASLMRELRGHWGTINGRHVEIKLEAVDLFKEIKKIVDNE